MDQTGLIEDVIVTSGVAVHGWGHAPTTSAPLSKNSLLRSNLWNSCGVISVSNRYSFLPIVVYFSALYSVGFVSFIYSLLLSLKLSWVIKPIKMTDVDRCYTVERVVGLATFHSQGERHLVLTVLGVHTNSFTFFPSTFYLPKMK